jgi:purine-binding chemotaxis protein CheW
MNDTANTPWDDNGQLEVLTFDVGHERLAIEATHIREIVDLLPETLVPGSEPLVASIVNYRGKIIPIADLRVAFDMPLAEPTPDSRIVVIETELAGEITQLGLRTDKVHEVAILNRQDSSPPPQVGLRWRRDYVRALVRLPDAVLALPDLGVIFDSVLGSGRKAA